MESIHQIAGLRRLIDRIRPKIMFAHEQAVRSANKLPASVHDLREKELALLERQLNGLCRTITGSDASDPGVGAMWSPADSFAREHVAQHPDRQKNVAYWDAMVQWIDLTGAFVDYLEGLAVSKGAATTSRGDVRESTQAYETQSYDVALSYAGEDREYVKTLADALREAGLSVFYDEYEKGTLWGKDLYAHLSDVYKNRAKFCIMIVSQHYARKLWTNHERKSAQARAFEENREYILPIRIDNTEIPGLLKTTGYIGAAETEMDQICSMLKEKLAHLR